MSNREILKRLADYDAGAMINEQRLVERWRKEHPLAAAETSTAPQRGLPR